LWPLTAEYDQWNAKKEAPRRHSTRGNGNGEKRPRGPGGAQGAQKAESDEQ
jgi:hypothetical protein